ncbi:MAG: ATP-binding protein [Verrucomicrobiota bacterium]
MSIVYYRRSIETRLQIAREQFPAVLVTGARQAGKSTLLRQTSPECRYVSLDDPAQRALAQNDPRLFLSAYPPPAIVDEIQYAPGLLPYLKMWIDEHRRWHGQYLLTGSQTFQLMEGVSETLAGRIAILRLYPFNWLEMQSMPGANQELAKDDGKMADEVVRGFYPEFFVNPALDKDLWFSSYLATYLERDVRNIKRISDLARFQTFVSLLATRAGSLLNMSELSKEVGITQPTAKDWITILESTSIVYLLRPYHQNLTKRLVKTPKLYFVDTGLLCYLLGIHSGERLMKAAERGRVFENMVVLEALKRFSARSTPVKFFFYRTPAGVEVDLLIEMESDFYAFEIKLAKTIDRRMASGLIGLQQTKAFKTGRILSLQETAVPITESIMATHWLEGLDVLESGK